MSFEGLPASLIAFEICSFLNYSDVQNLLLCSKKINRIKTKIVHYTVDIYKESIQVCDFLNFYQNQINYLHIDFENVHFMMNNIILPKLPFLRHLAIYNLCLEKDNVSFIRCAQTNLLQNLFIVGCSFKINLFDQIMMFINLRELKIEKIQGQAYFNSTIDLSNLKKLKRISLNNFSFISILKLDKLDELDFIDFSYTIDIAELHLPPNVKHCLLMYSNISQDAIIGMNSLVSLNMSYMYNLESMIIDSNIEHFTAMSTSMKYFRIKSNSLKFIDISMNLDLIEFEIESLSIKEINLFNLPIKILTINSEHLERLRIVNCQSIENVSLKINKICELDIYDVNEEVNKVINTIF